MYGVVSNSQNFETPVVANLNRFALLDSPQLSWTFSHEKPETTFERSVEHSFTCGSDAILHGFAGYFVAKLFGDVTLSITPGKDEDEWMLAWFPMYFPLKVRIFQENSHTSPVSCLYIQRRSYRHSTLSQNNRRRSLVRMEIIISKR
jgi:hypothetical protein